MNYFFTLLKNFGHLLVLSTGIELVFSRAGIFFLGFPTVITVSGYALAIAQREGVVPWQAFIVALVVALLTGLLFAHLYLKVSPDSFAVIGLASVLAVEALAKSWEKLTNGVLGIPGIARPEWISTLPQLMLFSLFLGVMLLTFEMLLLKSPLGRMLQGFKEDPLALEALGISSNRVAHHTILVSSVVFALGGTLMIWHVQFLDPGFGGLPLLVELLTIGILAINPKRRYFFLGIGTVLLLPEFLRFLHLPTTSFGHLRIFLYSLGLIILLMTLKSKLYIIKRSI